MVLLVKHQKIATVLTCVHHKTMARASCRHVSQLVFAICTSLHCKTAPGSCEGQGKRQHTHTLLACIQETCAATTSLQPHS